MSFFISSNNSGICFRHRSNSGVVLSRSTDENAHQNSTDPPGYWSGQNLHHGSKIRRQRLRVQRDGLDDDKGSLLNPHLLDKVKMLESTGFVRDISRTSVPYFRMSDEFKEMLKSYVTGVCEMPAVQAPRRAAAISCWFKVRPLLSVAPSACSKTRGNVVSAAEHDKYLNYLPCTRPETVRSTELIVALSEAFLSTSATMLLFPSL